MISFLDILLQFLHDGGYTHNISKFLKQHHLYNINNNSPGKLHATNYDNNYEVTIYARNNSVASIAFNENDPFVTIFIKRKTSYIIDGDAFTFNVTTTDIVTTATTTDNIDTNFFITTIDDNENNVEIDPSSFDTSALTSGCSDASTYIWDIHKKMNINDPNFFNELKLEIDNAINLWVKS